MSVLNSADGRSRPKGYAIGSDWKSSDRYYERVYRADIDGLRAIAVISVVAYHFHIGPPGGFIGVDIFFVISGYLITSIIVGKLSTDSFSFLDFYQRRIRRIFPALATMLVFMLVSGLTVLKTDELFRVSATGFDLLYRSIAIGAAFVTNFAQLHEATYFSETANDQPLLHLWSLAIEEQFYIVWPVLLYGVAWSMRVQFLPLALAVAAVSFGTNLLTVHTDPTFAFYSPLSRAWELMLGAAMACLSPERMQSFPMSASGRSAIGLVVIAIALFVVRGAGFPGWAALAPTIGTLLIISAEPKSLPNRSILSAKILVWIGLISYPLYLWHWPALLFFQKYSPAFQDLFLGRNVFKAAVLLCCVAASWLTYRFIEGPFRFGAWKDARHTAALALTMGAIALIGAIAPGIVRSTAPMTPYQRDTMSVFRRVAAKEKGDLYGNRACFRWRQTDTAAMFLQNNCLVSTHADRKTVFVVGDSHSASLSLGLRPLFEHYGMNFLQVSNSWCGEPISRTFESPVCEAITDLVMKTIAEVKPDLVIVDAHWLWASGDPQFIGDDYFAHLIAKLNDVLRLGAKRIAVVGEIPNWFPSLPESLALSFVRNDEPIPQRTFIGIDPRSLNIDAVMRTLNYPSGTTYLSMKDVLCNEAGCLTNIGPDLEHDLVVWDYGHLTAAASALVVHQLIEPAIADLISTPSAMATH